MTPQGVLVVTTLGDWGVMSLQEQAAKQEPAAKGFRGLLRARGIIRLAPLDPAMIDEGAAKYRSSGYGFFLYLGQGQLGYCQEEDEVLRDSQYGVCFTSPSWIENVAADLGFRRVYFREHGWDDLQDVHGFQLNPDFTPAS